MAETADSTLAPSGQALLTAADLNTTINHEPRVADLRLGEALGFERPRKIRELIRRHMRALERFGSVCPTRGKPGSAGGRPSESFWLNKKQALYITAKSDTVTAADITIQMVEVFDAWQSGQIAPISRPLAPGHLQMMVGRRLILIDAADYAIGSGDEALVCDHDGKVSVVQGPLEPALSMPYMGKRYASATWRKSKAQGCLVRPSFTVIGRVVEAGRRRRRIAG